MNKAQVREKLLEIFAETPVRMWLDSFPEDTKFSEGIYLNLFIAHFKEKKGFYLVT